ncbi:MAG: (d)CMP kinase [Stomatobaculum sp.]
MTQKIRALAIDGPAGAGKSTIARAVSRELGWIYVDTGAMFRALALFLMRSAVDAGDEAAVSGAVRDAVVSLHHENGEQQIFLNGENVSAEIRTEAVGNMASAVSVYPAVRSQLLELQRGIAASQPVVMDGRDIGTVVLPDADTKVYLTASVQVRALRRFKELQGRGQHCDLTEIERDIEARDYRDMHRETAPLRRAEEAVLLDSSDMSAAEVQARILELVKSRENQ